MDEWEKLKDIYRSHVFIKKDLEEQLGINLANIQTSINIPNELKPFLSRKTIQLKEAANIMAGYKPFHSSYTGTYYDDVQGYRAALWDAVDNNILTGKNLITQEDLGQEWREDISLNKNQVGKWASKYNYTWLLPIDDGIEELEQDDNDLIQRINQLEQELEKQKKINGDYVEVPFYKTHEAFLEAYKQGKHNPTNDREQELTTENNQLKIDNQNLTEQLNDAKKEIEDLKKQVPILLGKYRDDDLLSLAIKVRNEEWANYDHSTGKGKTAQNGIIAELMEKYKVSEKKAKAIELVACPIDRG